MSRLGLAGLFVFFFFCCNVYATHWAYGTANWKKLSGTPTTKRSWEFNLTLAFRRNYFSPLPNNPPPNGPYEPSGSRSATVCFYTCPSTSCPTSSSGNRDTCRGITMVPRDIIPLGNWFTGVVRFTQSLEATTSHSSFDYNNCCRLSSIKDTNNDVDWRIRGVINRYATHSPATTSFPRSYEDRGYKVKFSILATHPEGRRLTYELAPTSDSSLRRQVPSDSYTCRSTSSTCIETSSSLTIDQNLGFVTWSPSQYGLFSVAYKIVDADLYPGESSTNHQPGWIPLDMLFEIVPVQPAPFFYAPFPLSVPPQDRVIIFYRAVEGQYLVCARSPPEASNAFIEINSINLPIGASFDFSHRGSDAQGPFACYLVKWAPKIDDTNTTVCYLAKDTVNDLSSRGSYCILMAIGDARCIYVTGTIRDFHKSHADFALPKSGNPSSYNQDSGVAFVNATLNPEDRKPILLPSGSYTTTTNRGLYAHPSILPMKSSTNSNGEGYYDWWFTDNRGLPDADLRNKQRVETTILCNAGTPSDDIFRFLDSSYYPIDNQLFGNEGDDHNRYFTYEVNTYLTFVPGHVYSFKSSDDLHVFIEGILPTDPGVTGNAKGWALSGLRSNFNSETVTLNIDNFRTVYRPDLVANETYRCDIFYCHRNRVGDAGLQIDLPDFALCNGLTTGVTAFNFTTFSLASGNRGSIQFQGPGSPWPASGNYMQLISSSQTSSATAAWYAVSGAAAKVKALYGFRSTFTFQVLNQVGGVEGLAFVLLGGTTAASPGTQGSNLGYGSLARSIAIEFDADLTPQQNDRAKTTDGWTTGPSCSVGTPCWSEVSVHSRFADQNGVFQPNGADEAYSIGFSLEDPILNFRNGTTHKVIIEYVTGKLDPNGAPSPSVLRVFLNDLVAPVAQAIVDAGEMAQMMIGGACWVGLTAGNSGSKSATIAIHNWDMKVVPIAPTKTAPVTPPGSPINVVAGDTGVFRIQTKDECGNNILVGGEAGSFSANYKDAFCPGQPTFSASPVSDFNDGTYGLPYNPTRAATFQFDVRFGGLSISGNPFSFQVIPAATDPSKCPIIFGQLPVVYSNSPLADGLVVAVFDQYGKVRFTPQTYDFTVAPSRGGYTGGPTEFANFVTGPSILTGDYIVVVLNGAITISSQFATNAAVTSAMTALGATLYPPTAQQAYTLISIKGSGKCNETEALGSASAICRGSDTRSLSGARPFTISGESLLTLCGGSAGGAARMNSVFDTPRVPAGSLNEFSVIAYDQYLNLKTQETDTFYAGFVPDFTQQGRGVVISGADDGIGFDRGYYISYLNSTRSGTYQLYVKHDGSVPTGGSQYGMEVIITPGAAYLNTSNLIGGNDATGNGVTTATAGVTAVLYAQLRDRSGNDILSNEPTDVITAQLIIKQTGAAPSPPILLNFTWVNDTANGCSYCKPQFSYYTTKATVPGVYEYQLQVTINGDTGILSEPVVVAGPLNYPMSTLDCSQLTSPIFAGTSYSCNIQAKDQWGNLRYVPNFPEPDFKVASNSVYFTPSANVLTYSVSYPGAGVYRVTFTPKIKGDLSLDVESPTGIDVGGSPVAFIVRAGPPHPNSYLTVAPAMPNITAGSWFSFTMMSIDPYTNIRDLGVATASDYALRFYGVPVDGQMRIKSTSDHATTGLYTLEVRQTTPTGLYQLWVRTKFNDHVTSSPYLSVRVVPDMTFPNTTIISGAGVTACVSEEPAFFTLIARDEWTNQQLGTEDGGKFLIGTLYGTTSTPGTITSLGNGVYWANYTCPTLGGINEFVIQLYHPGQPTHSPPYASKNWTFPAFILPNAGNSYARLLNMTDQRAGIQSGTFVIKDCGNSACSIGPTAGDCVVTPCFSVSITNTAGDSVPDNQITVSNIGSDGTFVYYSLVFTSPFIGDFRIRVFKNRVTQTEESEAVTSGTPYFLAITPGYVDAVQSSLTGLPANVLAGETATIEVTLRDKFGYEITSPQDVQAIFQYPGGGASYGPVTCNQVAGANYECEYNVTTAGDWTVQIQSDGFEADTGFIRGGALSDIFELTVNPLGPHCRLSKIQDDLSGTFKVTAGATTTILGKQTTGAFSLFLLDVYGNAPDLTTSFTLDFNLEFNDADDLVAPFVYVFNSISTDGAQYDVTYAPTIANPSGGTSNLLVTLNGCDLPTEEVEVEPADPAFPPSSCSNNSLETVAGQPIELDIQLKDRYGNNWFDAPNRLSVTYRGQTNLQVASGSVKGSYTATLAGIYTQVAWIGYDFVISVDGNVLDFDGAERGFNVIAGPADPEHTTMSPASPQIVARQVTYQIMTNDEYGNPCKRSDGSDQIYFTFYQEQPACDEVLEFEPAGANPADYEITAGAFGGPYAEHVGGGIYEITWTGYKTAAYTFNITVNDGRINCADNQLQIIRPDVAYPPNCWWVIESPAHPSTDAGKQFAIRVNLRDRFDNMVDAIDINDVKFGADASPYNVSLGDVGFVDNPSKWMTAGTGLAAWPTVVVGSTETRNSAYNLLVTSYTASEASGRTPLAVFVLYQGTYYLIKGRQHSDLGDPVIDIAVIPGSAATFQAPAIIGTAAYPHNSFNLQAADLYGNPVTSSLHTYDITFKRNTTSNNESVVYNFKSSAVPDLSNPGQHVVDFLPYWHGYYRVEITMYLNDGTPNTYPARDQETGAERPHVTFVYIKHATCDYENNSTDFRCANRECKSAYNQCTNLNGDDLSSCSGTKIRCATAPTECANDLTDQTNCPCPTGGFRCKTGQCVPKAGTNDDANCPKPPSSCPPAFPHVCANTNYCRKASTDCPSPHVCTPGFYLCQDGRTCVRDAVQCPDTQRVCSGGRFRCPEGTCVNEFTDCPTPKSCGAGKVVCPDGSCKTSRDQCPDIYECLDSDAIYCSDGSCRSDVSECPTPVTCPYGYVLCESEVCAQSVADCPAATKCPLNQVRCPDGSCKHNMLFCASTTTCPVGVTITTYIQVNGTQVPQSQLVDLPVKCPDGSCKGSATQCAAPVACPHYRCPNGACIQCLNGAATCPDRCPSPTACSPDKPLLCLDGACVEDLSDCTAPIECPANAPLRCPDGSCRSDPTNCPSQPVCPASTPVSCPDGQCAASLDLCSPTQICPTTAPIRCPGGFCVGSSDLCPTLVTCPVDVEGQPTIKCLDGTCRQDCDTVTSPPTCAPQLTCPNAGAGVTCANSLADCPQSFACPSGNVRCTDSSCRSTVNDCPVAPAPTSFPPNRVPCPDGTWAADYSSCPTPVTCPNGASYKCWDGTCRAVATDCPVPGGCPDGKYMCPTGACTNLPWDQCSSSSSPCPPLQPVKCLADQSLCVAEISDCPNPYEGCPSGQTCTTCAGYVCKDGSCRQDAVSCPPLVCPAATPFLCLDGFCADAPSHCPTAEGCPWDAPIKCIFDGSCVAGSLDNCPAELSCPPNATFTQTPPGYNDQEWRDYLATLTQRCDDGSCQADGSQCYGTTGCPPGTFRCADGTCVDGSLCMSTNATINCPGDPGCACPCLAGDSTSNICPDSNPYRCPDGFCATSSTTCPPPIVTNTCPPNKPYSCASGHCVVTNTDCPLIVPCGPTEMRCADGTCRPVGHCPMYSTCPPGAIRCTSGICSNIGCDLINGCPVTAEMPNPVRCDNGLCAADISECNSIPSTGCPSLTPYKCPNGACKSNSSLCLQPNGCPLDMPYRCSADGSCKLDPVDCPQEPPANCYECADGRCVQNVEDCGTTSNCPVTEPYRCADGSCAKYPAGTNNPAACSPTVVCASNQVLCADGSCAASSNFCPTRLPCPAPQILCSRDWQCHDATECETLPAVCPPTSPVMCPNGACKSSVDLCGSRYGGPVPQPCPTETPIRCFDGACKATHSACMRLQSQVNGGGSNFPPTSSVNALCPESGFTMCWDGTCVEKCWQCNPLPRCASGLQRCRDGSCDTPDNCKTKNNALPACAEGLTRCEDGTCRDECCGYDGCGFQPHNTPFHCPNRECAATASDCDDIASGRIVTGYSRRLLQTVAATPTEPCYQNCFAQVKATTQTVTVSTTRATSIVVASNPTTVMTLAIPQGAITTNGSSTASLSIRAVSESRMRQAFNPVPDSRVGDAPYNYIRYLTFPQTVISPAFECNVDATVNEGLTGFPVNLTVTSLVDYSRRQQGSDVWIEDTCLAYLQEIGQYKNWLCVFNSQYDRRLQSLCPPASVAPGCTQGRFVVRDPATSPPPENLVSSVFGRCTQLGKGTSTERLGTVYAFITSPLTVYIPPTPPSEDIVQENIVPIVLGIIFAVLFFIFLMYMAVRLFRYRQKYHDERAEADRLKEEVQNMAQFGGDAGTKDDQVAMTENPLAAQLKHLQQAVKEEDIKLQQAEQGLRFQEAEIRKDHIDNMRSNRDKMMSELERLKAQLAEQQAASGGPSAMEDAPSSHYAQPAYSGGAGDASADLGSYGQSDDGAYRAGFDQYQAPGPKKKDF